MACNSSRVGKTQIKPLHDQMCNTDNGNLLDSSPLTYRYLFQFPILQLSVKTCTNLGNTNDILSAVTEEQVIHSLKVMEKIIVLNLQTL